MALSARKWTLEEMHALPEDGNKYELVYGELLVSPAPRPHHELLANAAAAYLSPYVTREALGELFRPRAVFRLHGSETEPDVMVRPRVPRNVDWEDMPLPILLVEVVSPSSRSHDFVKKRAYYAGAGIPTYWIFDADARAVHVIRPDLPDELATDTLVWQPPGAGAPLTIDLPALFREALDS